MADAVGWGTKAPAISAVGRGVSHWGTRGSRNAVGAGVVVGSGVAVGDAVCAGDAVGSTDASPSPGVAIRTAATVSRRIAPLMAAIRISCFFVSSIQTDLRRRAFCLFCHGKGGPIPSYALFL